MGVTHIDHLLLPLLLQLILSRVPRLRKSKWRDLQDKHKCIVFVMGNYDALTHLLSPTGSALDTYCSPFDGFGDEIISLALFYCRHGILFFCDQRYLFAHLPCMTKNDVRITVMNFEAWVHYCRTYQLLPKAALLPLFKLILKVTQKEIEFLTSQGTFRIDVRYSCFSQGHDTPRLNIFVTKVERDGVVNSA